jgi:hypothetical protein
MEREAATPLGSMPFVFSCRMNREREREKQKRKKKKKAGEINLE